MLCRIALGRTRQSLTALLTIATWFCLSNHCALGFGMARSELARPAEAGACPMHSAPAKEKPASNVPCCKDLRAVTAKSVANANRAPMQSSGAPDYAAEIIWPTLHLAVQVLALDTGPPGTFSFAESVLQRSLLAHAPPGH
jgi:hypothetical protein